MSPTGGDTGRRSAARLVQLFGIGLIGAGVFTADAGPGFPASAPEGAPDYSVHGILHEVSFVIAMLAWSATLVILYRWSRQAGDRALELATLATLATLAAFLTVLALSAFPHADSFPVRTVLASGLQLAYLATVARTALARQRS